MKHVSSIVLTLLTWCYVDASILCTWTKVLPHGESHNSFLRADPTTTSPRLYHIIWTASRTLIRCTFSDNQALIQQYRSVCEENGNDFLHEVDFNFDFEKSCTSLDTVAHKRMVRSANSQDDLGSDDASKRRVKRGFIVPGTLWCGSGNKAPSFEDLGVFSETDKCCREHDQCQETILSFHSKFGVFNTNIFTMSHCDCDNRFRSCLMEAQDSISNVVGYTFFNLLQMHCFEFSHRLQCTERNWFGMCKETKMSLYAEVHPPTLFESDTPANVTSINSTMTNKNTTEPALSTITAETTVARPLTNTSATTSTPLNTVRPQGPTTPNQVSPTRPSNQTAPLPDVAITEKQKSCVVYKYLDECGNRILPLQRKYGFRNNEPRTMYHCNCTNRFLQTLTNGSVVTEVDSLLLDHVSPSCFVLQDCSTAQMCTVVVLTAGHPKVETSGVTEQRRHLQAMGVRVRRPSLKRAAKKQQQTRLYRLCLRTILPRGSQNKPHRIRQDVRKRLE